MFTSGCSSQLHGEGLRDGEVDTVSEWSDHKSPVQAHVLVAVFKYSCKIVIKFLNLYHSF